MKRVNNDTWGWIFAAALPVVCLAPFLTKAFHIDDTVYIWVARQILVHPLDFFGFKACWYDTANDMFDINKNPPGISYFIALFIRIFGEREVPLHMAFMLPAIAVSVGTYALARRHCEYPALAVAAAVLGPGFITSSSNLMSDTGMLAFYVWAVVLWERYLDRPTISRGIAAGLCIALSALTKYYAISLIPLLGVYTVLRKPREAWRCCVLLFPIALLALYELYTRKLYGKGMFTEAGAFASAYGERGSIGMRSLIAFGFFGGCFPGILFLGAAMKRWWLLGIALAATVLAVVLLFMTGIATAERPITLGNGVPWWILTQLTVFAVGGVMLILLMIEDFRKRRDTGSLLLILWILGTFAFCAIVNWTVSARNVLPAAPAIGILLARRMAGDGEDAKVRWNWIGALAFSAAVAFAVTWGDSRMANANREAPRVLAEQFQGKARVYYVGHWGFQLYMDRQGAQPVDFNVTRVQRGDVIVVPQDNFLITAFEEPFATLSQEMAIPASSWISTTQQSIGAGFYGTDQGRVLPYALGQVPPETYRVYVVN